MKKLFILLLVLSAFSCANEPEVKPNNTPKEIIYTRQEAEVIFGDRGRGEDGCLQGSPAGYCCNWGGQIVMCVKL